MEGSLVAYKVFTNGSVLQASEINDNLMRQSVMVFSNAAARTAAISSPLEGMLTYLEDVNRYESYTGSAWLSPFGLTLISTTNISAQSDIQVSNVFTSAYNNYRIVIVGQGSVQQDLFARVMVSGGTLGSGYNYQSLKAGSSTVSAATTSGQSRWEVGAHNTSTSAFVCEVYNPAIAAPTAFHATGGRFDQLWSFTGQQTSHSVCDGFQIFTGAGLFTGIMRIYGYRNQA
jgi:hypothetical protein